MLSQDKAVSRSPASRPFFGTSVVRAAFVLAAFGWGVGLYGPPVFLHAVVQRTGWSLALVSSAVTVHFLVGAGVVALLPRLHGRFGLPAVTMVGAVAAAIGVLGWATAGAPWQLFIAVALTGAGWVTMGAVAINAVIAPWFSRERPMALAKAYNGASIGGVLFSPLWVALIAYAGFVSAAIIVGGVMCVVVAALARGVFAKTPASLGQAADGDDPAAPPPPATAAQVHRPLAGRLLWRDRRFVTLAAGMATGLFAQIGMLAHLFSLLVPAMGAQRAGLLMGGATACAIVGRVAVARVMPADADRRLVACAGYAVQMVGTLVLLAAGPEQVGWMVFGVLLFGSGIGNATSLPPLIAQAEFSRDEVQRVVALIVATAQATYAFAPAVFGLLLAAAADGPLRIGGPVAGFFVAVLVVQLATIGLYLAGRVAR